ncbi:MAG: hypothetical protein JSU01_14990 [Bacteroidetes bacterium]|nr:hypothetical protein [Bacteroidota bacterium]
MTRHSKEHGLQMIMKPALLLFFVLKCLSGFAQDKTTLPPTGNFEGIVLETDTKDRLAHVIIQNLNTRRTWYNTLKGEFRIDAQLGDKLVFTKEDFHADTLIVTSLSSTIVYMKRNAIMLHEVTILDSLHTPFQKLAAVKKEYSKVYSPRLNPDAFSTVPGGGAGINLDAIWASVSREGKDAARVRDDIQEDYMQNVIDYRFNKSYVGNITRLKGEELSDFMKKYRPSYYLVTNYTEYEFINYVKTSLRRYLRNRKALSQQPLKKPQS